MSSPRGGSFSNEQDVPVVAHHENLGQKVISTTEDKLKLALIEHLGAVEKNKEWVTPFSLFLTFFTTIIAADFSDRFLDAAVWSAIYVILAIGCFVFFLYTLSKRKKSQTIDGLIENIKTENS